MSSNPASDLLSVIVPANNEEGFIGQCLRALLNQSDGAGAVEVIVVSNASSDQTVIVAQSFMAEFKKRNWRLTVLDRSQPGKLMALNVGDEMASGDMRLYLDADIVCDPNLLEQLRIALSPAEARYATGTLSVASAKTWTTRQYARFWGQLPFVQSGAVGVGLYAVNKSGRKRWNIFPDIISDDTFVRVQFTPSERIEVSAPYHWPMAEGFANLVRVRRRQDLGVVELHDLYPTLLKNESKGELSFVRLLRLIVSDPLGFAVYGAVHIAVRLRRGKSEWVRGR